MHRIRIALSFASLSVLVGLAQPRPALAEQVKLEAALANTVLKADTKQVVPLRVALRGFKLTSDRARPPVNVAIVIDTSGSMQGEKLARAKEAARMAVERLSSRDITAIVTYSSEACVLVPATRLTDKGPVLAAISALQVSGGTALFAGVSRGAGEVRKFFDRGSVNRVILLSDGIANVGPSSPDELGDFGASLIKDGISVSTIGLGLGYNEDLMSKLARRSDGSHYFVENAADLSRIFQREIGDVLTVVAQEVGVEIRCAEGIRPVRVLGREADITGQATRVYLNQLYSEHEQHVLLEVEVPAAAAGRTMPVADVKVSYANLETRTSETLSSSVSVRFSASEEEVQRGVNREVMVSAVEQIATAQNELATKLRDQGKVEEARDLLLKNAVYLKDHAVRWSAPRLDEYSKIQEEDARNLDDKSWVQSRKKMRSEQAARSSQKK